MAGLEVFLGGVDQRLRRDAADVQAGAAEGGALHQYGGNAQLPGTDRRDVAAGTAADDQQGSLQDCLLYTSRRRDTSPACRRCSSRTTWRVANGSAIPA